MMKKCIFIGLILFVSAQAYSILNLPRYLLSWDKAIENTDSIEQLLPHLDSIEKVSALCELSLAWLVSKKQPEIARDFALDALTLSEQIGFNEGKLMANMLLSGYYMYGEKDTLRAIRELQRAEKLFDLKTHWTLKYRIWYDIGQKLAYLSNIDSAIYYYSKPLSQLNEDTAWLAHIGAYSWLNQYHRLKSEHQQLKQNLIKRLNIIFKYSQYRQIYGPKTTLSSIEYICMDFAVYGNYRFAVTTCQRALDSITAWEKPEPVYGMFRAKFLGRMARIYHHWGKFDSAIIYHDSAIRYFDNLLNDFREQITSYTVYPGYSEWEINMANQLEEKAGVLIKQGKLQQAETDIRTSIQMRRKHNDLLGVGMCFDKLGELYAMKGNFSQALANYDSALVIKGPFLEDFIRKNSLLSASHWVMITNESIAETDIRISRLYEERNLNSIAIRYLNQSLELSRKIGSQKLEAEALCKIGDNYLEANMKDSALISFQKAKQIYTLMGHIPGLGTTYVSMGNYYLALQNQMEAMKQFREAQRLFEQSEMMIDLARVLVKQANIYYRRNQLDFAKQKFEDALGIAEPIELKQVMLDCYSRLSEIFTRQSDFEKALEYHKEFVTLKDEIFNLETNKQITEIATQFETEQKEQRILLLEQESQLFEARDFKTRTLLFGFIGFMIVIFLWAILYIRQNRIRTEHEKANLQQRLLRSQMNPHFIFNSLSSIQNAIVSDQPAEASRYLARFSKLMRNILDSSSMETLSLDNELTTIENYLALQKIRFSDKFNYNIDVDQMLDTESITLPPMLAQPFIENAIEHGFRHKATKGMIRIRFKSEGKYLSLEIEDNGIGRKMAGEFRARDKKDYKSMATFLTQERIMLLNKGKKRKITMEITDLMSNDGDPEGTLVKFQIPV